MSRNEDQTKYDLITPKIEASGWRNHPAPNVQLEFPGILIEHLEQDDYANH